MAIEFPQWSEDEIASGWRDLHDRVNGWMSQAQAGPLWSAEPGSELAGDDSLAHPWRISAAVGATLLSALDHLHMLTAAVTSPSYALNTRAPFSLVRGAIENSAAAFWLIHDDSQDERIVRTVRWYHQDATDALRALNGVHVTVPKEVSDRPSQLLEVAKEHGFDGKRTQISWSCVVKYADEHVPALSPHTPPVPLLFTWQLCSGFLHARPWAALSTLDTEWHRADEDGMNLLSQECPPQILLMLACTAFVVYGVAAKRFRDRSRPRG